MSFDIPLLPLTDAGWVFAVLFALILVVPVLSERVRLPTVVGFVIAGMVVGPGVLGVLEREGAVELLGTAGLLYLMFVVGLELDLDEFITHRRTSVVFGVTSFAVPMVGGTLVGLALGFGWLAALLLASAWASHTLIAYPEFQRHGTARNRAVAVTVGATILTDTVALLALAVVAGVHRGAIGPAFWLTLIPGIVAFLAFCIWVVPVIARRFFSGLGQDRSVRFLFVMVVLFALAALAEMIGIEAIVGAFLAGLALNRLVPHGSVLMERIGFLGDNLLIPMFLVSVGLLVAPAVLADRRTLVLAAAFTVLALATKGVAAWGTGKLFGYEPAEIGAMVALSSAQAAATLAVLIVGLQIELLDVVTVNAVIAVILVTCLFSSWAADRYAPLLPHPQPKYALGASVVVPVSRPTSSRSLVRLAAMLTRPDGGFVRPVIVVPPESGERRVAAAREVSAQAEVMALSHGAEGQGLVRIDASAAAGVRHTLVEHGASLMVLGWKGATSRREALFGGILDAIVASTDVPTIIARIGDEPVERIVLVVAAEALAEAGRPSLALAVETARRLRADTAAGVIILSEQDDPELEVRCHALLGAEFEHDRRGAVESLRAVARPGDLAIIPTQPGRGRLPALGLRVAEAVPDIPVLVVLERAARELPEPGAEAAPWGDGPRVHRPGGG